MWLCIRRKAGHGLFCVTANSVKLSMTVRSSWKIFGVFFIDNLLLSCYNNQLRAKIHIWLKNSMGVMARPSPP